MRACSGSQLLENHEVATSWGLPKSISERDKMNKSLFFKKHPGPSTQDCPLTLRLNHRTPIRRGKKEGTQPARLI